ETRHVRLVVPVVMDLHRLRVDVRFEGVEGVGQLRQRVRGLLVGARSATERQDGGACTGDMQELTAIHDVSPCVGRRPDGPPGCGRRSSWQNPPPHNIVHQGGRRSQPLVSPPGTGNSTGTNNDRMVYSIMRIFDLIESV